ncbi:MAG: amidohydrolase [Bacillota bacterium]
MTREEPGLIIHGARVYTNDPGQPWADAVAVQGDRIFAVGRDSDLLNLPGRWQRRDGSGLLVLPGLTDSHTHWTWYALSLIQVNLEGIASLEEALAEVAKAAAVKQPGEVIYGSGWNKNLWSGFPTRHDLDRVAPDNPVVLGSKDGHATWVNTRAIERCELDAQTTDPDGGQLLREADGYPSGIFLERAAVYLEPLYESVMPADPRPMYRRSFEEAWRMGLTGIHSCEGRDTLPILQQLEADGQLGLRTYILFPQHDLEAAIGFGLRQGFGPELLKIGSVKAFADGALGPQTAYMLDDYEGRPDYRGIATQSKEQLLELARKATDHSFSLAIHAIGDRANREVLDVYETVLDRSRERGLRHRIEHAQLLQAQDIPRFAQLGVIASVQPLHATSDRYIADRYWGARARYAYAFGSLLRSGARLTLGSDVTVESCDPRLGIYAAVTRKRAEEPEVPAWYPEERLPIEEVIRGYTEGPAYASFRENRLGRVAAGYLADLTILDTDILADPESVLRARVAGTMVGGRLVYAEEGCWLK